MLQRGSAVAAEGHVGSVMGGLSGKLLIVPDGARIEKAKGRGGSWVSEYLTHQTQPGRIRAHLGWAGGKAGGDAPASEGGLDRLAQDSFDRRSGKDGKSFRVPDQGPVYPDRYTVPCAVERGLKDELPSNVQRVHLASPCLRFAGRELIRGAPPTPGHPAGPSSRFWNS